MDIGGSATTSVSGVTWSVVEGGPGQPEGGSGKPESGATTDGGTGTNRDSSNDADTASAEAGDSADGGDGESEAAPVVFYATGDDCGTTSANGAGDAGADEEPWRALHVTAVPQRYDHQGLPMGDVAAVDARSSKMAGKLVVDLGSFSGKVNDFLAKRGFHLLGVSQVNSCPGIDNWTTFGRDYDGNCRLNTLDGAKHGDQGAVSPGDSVMGQVLASIMLLDGMYPAEDWGYFLNKDGSVRWSDVAFTGMGHGAASAICFGKELRLYRAVARWGPGDNSCGTGAAMGTYDPTRPPFDPMCNVMHIASWIDLPDVTPIERFVGLVATQDPRYGDDLFTMQRMGFLGLPVDIATPLPPCGGSNRLYAPATGQVDPLAAPAGFEGALNLAFGVLPENTNPSF
jgi:hypothetical protein